MHLSSPSDKQRLIVLSYKRTSPDRVHPLPADLPRHPRLISGTTGVGSKKPRPSTGYLVRPRLGALRSLYSTRPLSAYASSEKRRKLKKTALPKMDWRKRPDYADTAYREAVGRLRILLAESYAPIRRPLRELDSAGEETDNQSLMSAGSKTSRLGKDYYPYYYPITPRRYYYPSLRTNYNLSNKPPDKNLPDPPKLENTSAPPELMSFIERQEEYIEQLEKESRFCREELSSLLSKVKDVISENENLHERQKSKLIKSVFEHLETETETETELENKSILKSPKKSKKTKIIDGPAIVFESRISELEAQLTQSRIDLKKALDENDTFRKKINDGTILDTVGYESYKKQLDNLHRDKETLQETVQKLQHALAILRDKENDTTDKVKRSLDVAEQAQYEKTAADVEIRRLKDELERQHLKLRDAIADQGRRIADERSAVERRYTQQIEQLTAELGVQWETANKMQLESDKQRRENGDLRREVAQKQALVDELKKDMQNKIITLQSDIGVSGAEKSALEQQIATLQMANERTERQYKQEISRLQAEIQSLRQRLDRADADLIHSRRENIRLSEQVASLEKEIALNAALSDERSKTPRGTEIVALPPPKEDREKELTSMIHDMENKHAATVAELENMMYSQNQLMDKLSNECHDLMQKLEDASVRHKEEIRELQTNLEYLNNKINHSQLPSTSVKDDGRTKAGYQRSPPQRTPEPIRKNVGRRLSRESLKSGVSSRRNSQEKPQVSSIQKAKQNDEQHSPKQQKPSDFPTADQPKNDILSSVQPQYEPRDTTQRYDTQLGSNLQEESSPKPYDTLQQDPTGQEYDPSQYPDPTQYDPTQHYDPNQQYDPNQPYDPNQQYDPNQDYQGYDPNQQYNQYDPNQDYDSNAAAAAYDPNQVYEGDPNQPYETLPGDPSQNYGVESSGFDQQYGTGGAEASTTQPTSQKL